MPVYKYVEKNGLAAKRSAGVSPAVNLKEHASHTPPPSTNKAAHSGFETQRRLYQKSKIGVSVAPKMYMCPSKLKKKHIYVGEHISHWLLNPVR